MRKLILYLFTAPILLISGCSWIEYFSVGNKTDAPITITYELNELNKGSMFGIFSITPDGYQLSNTSKIQWDNKTGLNDLDENLRIVKVVLPPQTIMIFGKLNNETYERYNQPFINGRDFNFNYMVIEHEGKTTLISKITFDDYFVKKNGFIKFDVEK